MTYQCEKCGAELEREQFYISKNLDKYPPDGRLRICKQCIKDRVDNQDPLTFLEILKEIDIPYIIHEWDSLIERYSKDDKTIIGRYITKMKLRGFKAYKYTDSDWLNEEWEEYQRRHKEAQL